MLAVDALEVAYGDLQVVWGVSFEVPEQSIVAIIGPNGAGKTTTLMAVMGLLPVVGGTVEFKDESIVGVRTNEIVDRGMVMIPESKATFPSMTVLENLHLGAYPSRARERQEETLDEVRAIFPRLAEREQQLAGTLSGGERQMLAIGKSLMARPELLILDEPSLGLAPIIVDDTFEAIEGIRKRGVSVLMVEQHVEQTLEVVDHAYVLELGQIVLDGNSGDLLDDPKVRDAYLSL